MTQHRAARSASVARSLHSTYVHLRGEQSAVEVPVSASFWQELMSKQRPELEQGRLITQFEFSESWTNWELHPAGEELVVLLSGRAELVLERFDGEESHALEAPGDFVIVPRATWHTADVTERCTMLFVTPGEGTQHRER